jgi:hypothetical protein
MAKRPLGCCFHVDKSQCRKTNNVMYIARNGEMALPGQAIWLCPARPFRLPTSAAAWGLGAHIRHALETAGSSDLLFCRQCHLEGRERAVCLALRCPTSSAPRKKDVASSCNACEELREFLRWMWRHLLDWLISQKVRRVHPVWNRLFSKKCSFAEQFATPVLRSRVRSLGQSCHAQDLRETARLTRKETFRPGCVAIRSRQKPGLTATEKGR